MQILRLYIQRVHGRAKNLPTEEFWTKSVVSKEGAQIQATGLWEKRKNI